MYKEGTSQAVLVVKNLTANAGNVRDGGSIPGLGRSPGGGHGNALQYSCLENPTDRGVWQATIHGVARSLTEATYHTCTHAVASGPVSPSSTVEDRDVLKIP